MSRRATAPSHTSNNPPSKMHQRPPQEAVPGEATIWPLWTGCRVRRWNGVFDRHRRTKVVLRPAQPVFFHKAHGFTWLHTYTPGHQYRNVQLCASAHPDMLLGLAGCAPVQAGCRLCELHSQLIHRGVRECAQVVWTRGSPHPRSLPGHSRRRSPRRMQRVRRCSLAVVSINMPMCTSHWCSNRRLRQS